MIFVIAIIIVCVFVMKSQTCCVNEAGYGLLILLPLTLKYWDYGHVTPG